MRSGAPTVEEYLAQLPPDRREAIATVRQVIVDNLPEGYAEAMNWGMISYEVPLERYPDTYNGKPLMYAALASQKRHMALYLTGIYTDPNRRAEFEQAYAARGLRPDIGQSCVRFRKLEELPLDLVAAAIAAVDVESFIAEYEAGRR